MTDEYDKEQLRILRNAFKAFDNDEKGYIEHGDVHTILEILGQKLDDKAVKALVKEVDKGTSGKLDFNQFCKLAARFVEVEEDTTNLAHELKEAFRVYDKEGKGYLTVQVLRDILHELDDKISKEDLDLIIEEIDADGSGTVDFDEFMQVMTGKDFYQFISERRFVFDPPLSSSSSCVYHLPHASLSCHCPAHRLRLHKRIESHFERLFKRVCQQPLALMTKRCQHTCTKLEIVPRSTPSPTFQALRNVFEPPKAVPACHRSACYRVIFRPRFPKWVPILTLYREVVRNPFKARGRYMITSHE